MYFFLAVKSATPAAMQDHDFIIAVEITVKCVTIPLTSSGLSTTDGQDCNPGIISDNVLMRFEIHI